MHVTALGTAECAGRYSSQRGSRKFPKPTNPAFIIFKRSVDVTTVVTVLHTQYTMQGSPTNDRDSASLFVLYSNYIVFER